jgi:hypothetical protein
VNQPDQKPADDYPGETSEGLAATEKLTTQESKRVERAINLSEQQQRSSQIPTPGRIVLYTFSGNTADQNSGQSSTVPAIVVNAFSEICVNLRVFQDGPGRPLWKTSVMRKGAAGESNDYWEWPPRV